MFQIACGSVIGRDHIHDGRNNQDAFHILEDSDFLVAVVCDGCGDASRSEVGAVIGSRFVTQAISRHVKRNPEGQSQLLAYPEFWLAVREDVLAQLRVLALQMGDSLSEVMATHFLFTIVGVLITPEISVFFSLGDGTIFVNGERYHLGPYPNNAPPYLGYGLVETTQEYEPSALRFRVVLALPTDDLKTFLIGTDGVDDLINAEGKNLPGRQEPVGQINQLWRDDRFFNNRVALTRRLNLLNAEARVPDWDRRAIEKHPGLLHDDTTIVVGRRKMEGG